MRLGDADLASIPGAAAWFSSSGALIAATPEWRGRTPGTTAYCAGELTLLVTADADDADTAALCDRLVDTLQCGGQQTTGRQRLRLETVVACLRMILGSHLPQEGSTSDVVALLDASLELANPPVRLDSSSSATARRCPSPHLVALALKQLATNAQRHSGASSLTLLVSEGPTFRLRWRGSPLARPIATSRHPSRRDRWGAGFARLAADAVGAVIYDPITIEDGALEVVFAIQPSDLRLRLPLALVDSTSTVTRSTRSWDEETHALPGQRLADHEATRAYEDATAVDGQTARSGAFAGRASASGVWVALLPADTQAQAADLIAGLAHEHDLLRVPEPHRTLVLGLAAVIRTGLGARPQPWDRSAVAGPFATASAALGLEPTSLAVPHDAPTAPDPLLTAFVVSELGGQPTWDSVRARWRLDRADARRSPAVARQLMTGGDIFLS